MYFDLKIQKRSEKLQIQNIRETNKNSINYQPMFVVEKQLIRNTFNTMTFLLRDMTNYLKINNSRFMTSYAAGPKLSYC